MRKRLIVVVLATLFLTNGLLVSAADKNIDLEKYRQKLEELNYQLGTNYEFSNSEDMSKQEMISYYTSMNIEEFEELIRNAHKVEIAQKEEELTKEKINIIKEPRSSMQKYWYDGRHYLSITADTRLVLEYWFMHFYQDLDIVGIRILTHTIHQTQ